MKKHTSAGKVERHSMITQRGDVQVNFQYHNSPIQVRHTLQAASASKVSPYVYQSPKGFNEATTDYKRKQSLRVRSPRFESEEKEKLNQIFEKMKSLKEKIKKVEQSVVREVKLKKATQSPNPKYHYTSLKLVRAPALQLEAFRSQKTFANNIHTTNSRVSTSKVGLELEIIQEKIAELNRRKEQLLNSLDTTGIVADKIISDQSHLQNSRSNASNSRLTKNTNITRPVKFIDSKDLNKREDYSGFTNISQSLEGKDSRTTSRPNLYTGQVLNGLYEGRGRLTNVKYSPLQDNFLDNLGDILFSQENNIWIYYEGQFSKGRFHGLGNLFIGDTHKLTGQFEGGLAHGRLSIINKRRNQIEFVGLFRKGFVDSIILHKS